MSTVLVAIPVFNEARYVASVLNEVRTYARYLVVIDDGSTDGTSDILKRQRGIDIIYHESNMGYGRTLIDAFDFASNRNFDWVITLDCDLQHKPSYLRRFYSEIEKANCDIISGSRYLKPKFNHNSLLKPPTDRIIINRLVTQILNDNLSIRLTDSFCGFKACRVPPLSGLGLTEQGYGFPLQFLIRAIKAGLRILEIPVPLIYMDPTRCFGADLDDPSTRIKHYCEIIERELGYDIGEDIRACFHSERQKRSICEAGYIPMAESISSEQNARRRFAGA